MKISSEKYKLLSILKSFNWEELRNFRKFAASAHVNKGRNYGKVIAQIYRCYPDFDSDSFTFENVFGKLNDKKKLNVQVIKNRLSELGKIAEEFLVHTYLAKNDADKTLILLHELKERNLLESGNRYTAKAKKAILKQSKFSFENLLRVYRLERDLEEIYNKRNDQEEHKKFFLASIDSFLLLFLCGIFDYKTELIDLSKVHAFGDELRFFELVSNNLLGMDLHSISQSSANKRFNIVYMYLLEYKLLSDPPDENSYFILKQLFFENYDSLELEEQRSFYAVLILFCRRKYNEGDSSFGKDRYNFNLKYMELLRHTGYRSEFISLSHFRETLLSGIIVKEFTSAESFIHEYVPRLAPEYRDEMYNYSMFYLNFRRGDLEQAAYYLAKYKPDSPLLKLERWHLQIMLDFEMKEYERTLSDIKALQRSLKHLKGLSKRFITMGKNFATYGKILAESSLGKDVPDIKKWKSNLANETELMEKTWMAEKFSLVYSK